MATGIVLASAPDSPPELFSLLAPEPATVESRFSTSVPALANILRRLSDALAMLATIPKLNAVKIHPVPPREINGSAIPLVGAKPVTTAALINACMVTVSVKPMAISDSKLVTNEITFVLPSFSFTFAVAVAMADPKYPA